ncbi:MAG TPA: protease complex subunit PrcB family protein [Candidatus Eisenbacteria bacterium]
MVTEWQAAAVATALMMGSIISTGTAQASGCQDTNAQELSFQTLEHYAVGPYMAGASILVQSAAEWNEQFDEMAADGKLSMYPVDAPSVDWGNEYVIVVAMGECPSLGYDIEIEHVWQESDGLVIGVRSVHPNGATQAALTSPYHMISIKATDVTKISLCDSGAPKPRIPVRLALPGDDRANESARITVTWSSLKSHVAS